MSQAQCPFFSWLCVVPSLPLEVPLPPSPFRKGVEGAGGYCWRHGLHHKKSGDPSGTSSLQLSPPQPVGGELWNNCKSTGRCSSQTPARPPLTSHVPPPCSSLSVTLGVSSPGFTKPDSQWEACGCLARTAGWLLGCHGNSCCKWSLWQKI